MRVPAPTVTGVAAPLGRLDGTTNWTAHRPLPLGAGETSVATWLTPPIPIWTYCAAGKTLFESARPYTARITTSPAFAGFRALTGAPEEFVAAVIAGGGGSTCINTGGMLEPPGELS